MKLYLRLSEGDGAELAFKTLEGAAQRHAALRAELPTIRELIRTIDSSGQAILRAGGDFHSTREVKGNGFAVTIEARFGRGAKESFLGRLFRRR